jgi:hypothetical protein
MQFDGSQPHCNPWFRSPAGIIADRWQLLCKGVILYASPLVVFEIDESAVACDRADPLSEGGIGLAPEAQCGDPFPNVLPSDFVHRFSTFTFQVVIGQPVSCFRLNMTAYGLPVEGGDFG